MALKREMKYYAVIIPVLIVFLTCGRAVKQENKGEFKPPKTLNLDYGFKISFADSEDFGDFRTYWKAKIYLDDKVLFEDTSDEYEIKNNYPSIREINDGFEILLYLNRKSWIDLLRMLVVKNDTLVKNELLPNLEMKPRDIDNDGVLEVAGIMSYYEMFGDNRSFMPYDPILVYEYTANGIQLDSTQTEKVNINAYGKFYGFEYNENLTFKGNEKFENEFQKYK